MSSLGGSADPELLAGFRDEVAGYLPVIRQGLDAFARAADRSDLVEPHRLLHTIKGAASMLDLVELSEIARQGEDVLEGLLAAAEPGADPALIADLRGAVDRIELSAFGESGAGSAAADLAPGAALTAPLDDLPAAAVDEILAGFREEAGEHLGASARLLRELARAPGDLAPITELRRVLHTFKGAAAVVGFARLAGLCHRMEDLAETARMGPLPLPPAAVDRLFAGLEEMEALVLGELSGAADGATRSRELRTRSATAETRETRETVEPAGRGSGSARGDLRRLQEVLRLSGELVVNHAALEERFGGLRRQLQELQLAVTRLRQVARRIDGATDSLSLLGMGAAGATAAAAALSSQSGPAFDPLELDRYTDLDLMSRSLAETAGDLAAITRELDGALGGAETDRRELKQLTRALQDQMLRLRLAPLGTLSARLHRTVRATAAREGKRVDLVLVGEEVELDRTILDGLADPLSHLLRNAVAHGIEAPAVRRERGKPDRGRVEVLARVEGSQVAIEVRDDGAGLDREAIRAAAAAAGLASPAADAPDAVAHLIFLPGFTTAPAVGEVSGRGVGLDVVKTEVERLRGAVSVESSAGAGSTFTLRLPQSLALARVLRVRAGGETLAVPTADIVEVLRREPGAAGLEPVIRAGGDEFPLRRLADLLALPASAGAAERPGARPSVLLLAAGGRRLALAVDDLAGTYDAVVGGLGTLLPRVRGVSGATVAPDGRLLLVLNPAELLAAPAGEETPRGSAEAGAERRSVLVVDDSLSVRRVLAGLLRSAGWEVLVARDGREALELLQSAPLPGVAVVDVEMPRMNGYELLASLRREPTLRDLPVVFLTSRAGEKHRAGALSLGANGYLVKPYDDAHLLATLHRLARPPVRHVGA